ncbi:SAE2-domain-containing protein [Aureobasidium namibiae CBS 147.97]|uniref:SAE2-domain-containing protein n=1 Tax=Aureobasidium namibiae CBS 147.97 TaxID=1043004 RepID=A0A074WU93_9PEZI
MEAGQSNKTPDGFVTLAQYNQLLAKHEALQKTYSEYRRDAETRALKAAQKIREAKEAVRRWKDYIDKKLAKQALLLAQQANRDLENQDFATPRAVQSNLENIQDALALPNPALNLVRDTSAAPSHSPAHPRITSSQTTEGEARSSSHAHSDDTPVVVSAKSLKRKHQSPKKDSQGHRVKNELLSSSPHNSRTPVPTLFRTETSDLDVYRDQPPLRQPNLHYERHPLSRAPLRQSADPSPETMRLSFGHLEAPTGNRVLRSRSPNDDNNVTTASAGTDVDADDARLSDSTVKTVKTEPGSTVRRENMLVRTMSKSAGPPEPRPQPGPLHDLSPNTPTLPRTSAAPLTSGKKLDHSRGAASVHVLSEDGDNARRGFKKPRIDDTTPKAAGTGRLNGLLEGTSPQVDRTISSPRSAPGAVRRQREWLDNTVSEQLERYAVARSVEKPVSRITRTVRDKPLARAAIARYNDKDDPGDILPEHEPLRARPLHRLNLEDFRVNPKVSGELGYAYRESIRKREEKKCLPGCTREECCGAIRRFIAAGGLPQDTSLTDDELTLQGYLGSAYASLIHSATGQERQKMLLEARAKAFADTHGKHREVFQRNRTPPGFWRTEMPSTQELEQDWEEARKMDRQKVEERWREAMRGGRYIFRDET